MRRRLLPSVIVAVLVMAAPAGAEQPHSLKGKWKVVSADREGKPIKQYIGVVVAFEDDRYTAQLPNGDKGEADVKLDTAKKPWTIDMTPHYGPNDGKLFKGICKIEGDTMTLCRGDAEKERPTEFSSKPGTGQTVIVFKRVDR